MNVVGELAHQIGALPLLWLGALYLRGRRVAPQYWWLAAAFFVSWLADTAAHWVNPGVVGNVYPVLQAAIAGAVLLDQDDAALLILVLFFAGVVSIGVEGPAERDVFLATVANGSIAVIAWRFKQLGRLRWSLLVSYGVVGVCWWAFAGWPTFPVYVTYQGARLVGILLFCWASVAPRPPLRLAVDR